MNPMERFYSFAAACFKGSVELLYYSFFWIVIAFYFLEPLSLIGWLILLVIGYSSYYLLFANKKHTYFNIATYIVLYSGFIFVVLELGFQSNLSWYSSVLLLAFTVFFLVSGFRQYSLQFQQSFHITFMALSIFGHVVIQILKVVWLTELQTLSTILNVLGIGTVLITLFITNERMLTAQQQLLGKSTVLKHAVHLNRIILSFISIVIIAIILFRSWQEQIEHYIKAFFNWLINLFSESEELPEEEPPVEAAMPDFMFGGEEVKEPSLLGKIVEAIFTYLAYIALAIVVIVILFLLVRLLIKAVALLVGFLKKRSGIFEEEQPFFIDEIEQIEKVNYSTNRRPRKGSRHKKWNSLSKHEKCTYLYTLFIKQLEQKGYQYLKHLTINEQMDAIAKQQQLALTSIQQAKLIKIYEQAKYGLLEEDKIAATDDELNLFFSLFTKKVK